MPGLIWKISTWTIFCPREGHKSWQSSFVFFLPVEGLLVVNKVNPLPTFNPSFCSNWIVNTLEMNVCSLVFVRDHFQASLLPKGCPISWLENIVRCLPTEMGSLGASALREIVTRLSGFIRNFKTFLWMIYLQLVSVKWSSTHPPTTRRRTGDDNFLLVLSPFAQLLTATDSLL